MSNKIYLSTYLPTCLSVRLFSIYFYKVRFNQTRYALTKRGTSWPNKVRVDLGDTSWLDNGYELIKKGTSWLRYELTRVQVGQLPTDYTR